MSSETLHLVEVMSEGELTVCGKTQMSIGSERLVTIRYEWLKNPNVHKECRKRIIDDLQRSLDQ